MFPRVLLFLWLALCALAGRADDPWLRTGANGGAEVQLYFFWALTCPHCTEAHPHVEALPRERPWLRLHDLELTRHSDHARLYQALAAQVGGEAVSVPAFLFCGEMVVGWESDATTGAYLRQRLDACHARAAAGAEVTPPATA
ncbi:MAG: cytochrome c bioproteinis protein transmembrane region, partial [bacterium]